MPTIPLILQALQGLGASKNTFLGPGDVVMMGWADRLWVNGRALFIYYIYVIRFHGSEVQVR
jgi:hypothetical protein